MLSKYKTSLLVRKDHKTDDVACDLRPGDWIEYVHMYKSLGIIVACDQVNALVIWSNSPLTQNVYNYSATGGPLTITAGSVVGWCNGGNISLKTKC